MLQILMATYNGEQYLEQQISSILNQTYSAWQLCIADDGSTDATLDIVERYCNLYPQKIKRIDSPSRQGVLRTFETLLQHATADYVMFADQDDVWMEDKIRLTFQEINSLEHTYSSDVPLLVHTNMTTVDSELHVLAADFWQSARLSPKVLDKDPRRLAICNCVTGCTVMLNRAAINVALPFPDNVVYHDAWLGLSTSLCGHVGYVTQPTMLYRQHQHNLVGARPYSFSFFERLIHIPRLIRRDRVLYHAAHPQVFHNWFHFACCKVRHFVLFHIFNS
ncbi:MAG: glycosyltransferase family 2 protein [Paludibacteraceae bacterium]|nr:glycosyltransferase family 2 protein [Paludibacteraceae bacterium]